MDRPKPTVGCSASGRKKKKKNIVIWKLVECIVRRLEEMSKGENIVKLNKRAKDKLVRSPRENGGR